MIGEARRPRPRPPPARPAWSKPQTWDNSQRVVAAADVPNWSLGPRTSGSSSGPAKCRTDGCFTHSSAALSNEVGGGPCKPRGDQGHFGARGAHFITTRGDQGHLVLKEHILSQPEVIRAILFKDSVCCGDPHQDLGLVLQYVRDLHRVRDVLCNPGPPKHSFSSARSSLSLGRRRHGASASAACGEKRPPSNSSSEICPSPSVSISATASSEAQHRPWRPVKGQGSRFAHPPHGCMERLRTMRLTELMRHNHGGGGRQSAFERRHPSQAGSSSLPS